MPKSSTCRHVAYRNPLSGHRARRDQVACSPLGAAIPWRGVIADRLWTWEKPNPRTEVHVLVASDDVSAARTALRRARFNPQVFGVRLGRRPKTRRISTSGSRSTSPTPGHSLTTIRTATGASSLPSARPGSVPTWAVFNLCPRIRSHGVRAGSRSSDRPFGKAHVCWAKAAARRSRNRVTGVDLVRRFYASLSATRR
jgi:hypothetical protein